MPLPVQSPGPAGQLEERYAFKGGIRLFLDETIVPVEVIAPRARKYAMGKANVAAAAGFVSEVALVNPLPFERSIVDNEILIHKIWVSSQSTHNFELVVASPSGFTNLTTKSFLDLKLGLAPSGLIQQKNTAIATVGTVIGTFRRGGNILVPIDLDTSPIVLGSGANSVIVRPQDTNAVCNVTYLWSEPPDPA